MTGDGDFPRRTIDLDLTSSPRGWSLNPTPAYGVVRRRGRVRGVLTGIALPLLAGGMFVLGAIIGLPVRSQAQPSYWHSYTAAVGANELEDAIVTGGESGLSLYSCRATVGETVQIGRYRRDFAGCHIGIGGKETEAAPFELLSAEWQNGTEGTSARPLIAGEISNKAGDGADSMLIYPCRASYQNGLHPGYVSAKGGGCSFGYGGKTVTSQNFSVLQSAAWLSWIPAVPQNLPDSAVSGGQEGGEPLFVCRAPDPHGLISGKLKKSSIGCSIPSDGRELVVKRFEVLVPRWTVSTGGAVPVAAVPVGRDAAGLLYLCHGQSRAMLQPGRLSESLAGCHVGMQGGETVLQDYEVLTQ